MTAINNPVLVALDVPSVQKAARLAEKLEPYVGGFKVGLELLMRAGPAAVSVVAKLEKPVFADAKLHDIPSTVRAAAEGLGEAGARWVTAHAAGGRNMLQAAVEGLNEGTGTRISGILAVSVLTSISESDLAVIGAADSIAKLASRRARLATEALCEGVITSPRELSVINDTAPTLLKVVPGIRPEGAPADDQARRATPRDALAWGADYLVIGRPITEAKDPVAAARDITNSIGHTKVWDLSPQEG